MTVHFIAWQQQAKVKASRLKVSRAFCMFHEHCTRDTYWNHAVEIQAYVENLFRNDSRQFRSSGSMQTSARKAVRACFRLNPGRWRRLSRLLGRNGRVTPEERLLAVRVTMPFSTWHMRHQCDRNMQKTYRHHGNWICLCVPACVCVRIDPTCFLNCIIDLNVVSSI